MLGLLLDEKSASDVAITSLGAAGTCNHGTLNLERIKDRVTEGVTKANESFGTTFKVKEIEYVENDTPDYNLYAYCAFLIIKGLHEGVEFTASNGK